MSIEDKLREILEDEESGIKHCCGQSGTNDIGADIAQILKTIQEEGYVKTLRVQDRTIVLNGKDPLGYVVYYPDEVMTTSQLSHEINKLNPVVWRNNDGKTYYMIETDKLDELLTPKKASGISDE